MKDKKNVMFLLVVAALLAGVGLFSYCPAVETAVTDDLPGPACPLDRGTRGAAAVRGNAYMNVLGIPGESQDVNHPDWIDILAFNHNISVASLGSGGSSRRSRGPRHDDIAVVKEIDKASPKLALYCCNGTHIQEVNIELCRAEDGQKYMAYKLTDVVVSSVAPSYSHRAGGEFIHIEEVTFRYGKIEWTYTEYDDTGASMGNVEAWWDVTTGTGG